MSKDRGNAWYGLGPRPNNWERLYEINVAQIFEEDNIQKNKVMCLENTVNKTQKRWS